MRPVPHLSIKDGQLLDTTPTSNCMNESCSRSAAASSSLVDLETNVQFTQYQSDLQYAIQSRYEMERKRILSLLAGTELPSLMKRAQRITECSQYANIVRLKGDEPKLIVSRCKDRMCPRCSRVNAYKCSEALHSIISRMPTRRAITLTLAHDRGDLSSRINRLMHCWKELRRSKQWKEAVDGGIYSLEITRNEGDGTWHPHLHVIVTGTYYEQKTLADQWFRITGDSKIVYIQAVHDARKMGGYISKYVTKPDEVIEWEDDVLLEYICAIRGRRMFHTFGCLHNTESLHKPRKLDFSDERPYASPQAIKYYANQGCEHCQEVIDRAKTLNEKWRAIFGVLHQQLLPGFDGVNECTMDEMHILLDAATSAIEHRNNSPPERKAEPRQPATLFEDVAAPHNLTRENYSTTI